MDNYDDDNDIQNEETQNEKFKMYEKILGYFGMQVRKKDIEIQQLKNIIGITTLTIGKYESIKNREMDEKNIINHINKIDISNLNENLKINDDNNIFSLYLINLCEIGELIEILGNFIIDRLNLNPNKEIKIYNNYIGEYIANKLDNELNIIYKRPTSTNIIDFIYITPILEFFINHLEFHLIFLQNITINPYKNEKVLINDIYLTHKLLYDFKFNVIYTNIRQYINIHYSKLNKKIKFL
jgi:hypothetical protein